MLKVVRLLIIICHPSEYSTVLTGSWVSVSCDFLSLHVFCPAIPDYLGTRNAADQNSYLPYLSSAAYGLELGVHAIHGNAPPPAGMFFTRVMVFA